ncbi:MAG: hypothetical protein Q8O30_06110, partial [Candidatus Omnitrophota bacterium]|nr:hypothetical protein [Candidatus Omnitrophota bacterium]
LTTLFILFRFFNYTAGYFNNVANYFNRFFKGFIVKEKKAPLFLKRKVEIRNDAIVIHDRLSTKSKIRLSKLNIQNDVTTMYSPTSRYFTLSDFMSNSLKNNELSRAFRKTGALNLSVELKFDGRKPSLDVRLNGSPLEVRFK